MQLENWRGAHPPKKQPKPAPVQMSLHGPGLGEIVLGNRGNGFISVLQEYFKGDIVVILRNRLILFFDVNSPESAL